MLHVIPVFFHSTVVLAQYSVQYFAQHSTPEAHAIPAAMTLEAFLVSIVSVMEVVLEFISVFCVI
ncbi:MAG: hypothetical protein F6K09_04235, partial [Merismopedia sp. SIO2A8]|nr:hypothetical protein [Merismopedia sp. SIO2A8]